MEPVIRAVVFDLDDTLYLERDYVRSGFHCVSEALACETASGEELFQGLWADFAQGVRNCHFDRLVQRYPQLAGRASVAEMVRLYRAHQPESLQLLPALQPLLETLRPRQRLGLISDGRIESQQAKIRSMNLGAWIDEDAIVLTERWGREFWKPHERAFRYISDLWGCRPEELVYVADNPAKDFRAPRQLGWHTVRLRLPEQLHCKAEPASLADAPECEVTSVAGLSESLCRLAALAAHGGLQSIGKGGPR